MKNHKYWVIILEDGMPVLHAISRVGTKREAWDEANRFMAPSTKKHSDRCVAVLEFRYEITAVQP